MRNLSSGFHILLNVNNLLKRFEWKFYESFLDSFWVLNLNGKTVNLGHFKAYQQKYRTYLIKMWKKKTKFVNILLV